MLEKEQIRCELLGLFLHEFQEKNSVIKIRELQKGLGAEFSYSRACIPSIPIFGETSIMNSILITINKEIPTEYSPFEDSVEKVFLNISIFIELEYLNGFMQKEPNDFITREFMRIFENPNFHEKLKDLTSNSIQNLEVYLFSTQLQSSLFEAWIYQYLYEVSNATFETIQPRSVFIFKQDDIEKIQNLESIIKNTRINSMPSILEMAESVGMSPTKFKKIFKEIFGTSTRQYILDVKTKQAQSLLKANSYSLAQVAHKLGFNNPSGLARLLKNKL